MSLRIAPPQSHSSAHTLTAQTGHSAPSAPGLFDTLRANTTQSAAGTSTALVPYTTSGLTTPAAPTSTHPLEARLNQWRATQQALQTTLLRRQYGIAAPVIRGMELLDCARSKAMRPSALDGVYGSGVGWGVHEDVLSGRDCGCDWDDVFDAGRMGMDVGEAWGVHEEMESRRGMLGW